MKQQLRRIGVMLGLALTCIAQSDPALLTGGSPNGLFWRNMPRMEKLSYVKGFEDGAGVRLIPGDGPLGTLITCAPIDLWTSGLPKAATNYEVIAEIDNFYKSAEHIPFPISDAMVYSLSKLKGASSMALERYLAAAKAVFYVH